MIFYIRDPVAGVLTGLVVYLFVIHIQLSPTNINDFVS